ncbi:MAG: hypothetical protein J2P18_21510, partial [Nocardia sp.]|nr:hypothetical protein [Nocardia sp.]
HSSHKTATTTSAANTPPVPSVADLNAELSKALDPNVPAAQKAQWLEDGQAAVAKDPNMMSNLTKAYQQANAKINITGVQSLGGDTVTAQVDFSTNGQPPTKADVPFVAQNGQWVLQKSWACNALKNLGQQSPACT